MAARQREQAQASEERLRKARTSGKRSPIMIPTRGGGVSATNAEDRIGTWEVRVAALERELETLKRDASGERESEVVVLRTMSREQAKQEIRELFASGETLYYSDIVQRLAIDIDLVIDICYVRSCKRKGR